MLSKLKAILSALEPVGHVHREATCGSLSAGEGRFGKTLGRPQSVLGYSASLAKQHWVHLLSVSEKRVDSMSIVTTAGFQNDEE